MTASHLVDHLYSAAPQEDLYHYTSLGSLLKIVESGVLYASDMRFFNDSAELRHTADILRTCIAQRIETGSNNPRLLSQFREWVSERIGGGNMQFAVSFTANGNLLSQWRSYCPHGRGVSIGFRPETVCGAATAQGFRIGECIYDGVAQRDLLQKIIEEVEKLAEVRGEALDPAKRHPSQSYHGVFEEVEDDLLRIAGLLKHGAFKQEQEWRAVSPILVNYVKSPIKYREGKSMLIPYLEFSLRADATEPIPLEHVYLGPTPNPGNSMTSLSRYLSKYRANPKRGLTYCQVPYREQ